jgi:GntR family transcriptional regulator/MocR family aminotransferase
VASSFDFLVPVDRTSGIPLRDQLYRILREAILDGRLQAAARLPSTRLVAGQTGLARQTVVEAYDQLVAEGYAIPRPASGTYVAETLPDDLLRARARRKQSVPLQAATGGLSKRGTRLAELPYATSPRDRVLRPFQTSTPALDAFPFDDWARLIAGYLRNRPAELLGHGDPAGYRPLREAIAGYVSAVRAARCTADQVIITAGTQQSVHLAAQVLLDPGDPVWVEEPGDPGVRAALLAAGARLVPVPVDADGLDVAAGTTRCPNARLALVTPSHHFPLGAVMSLQRRRALLEWARRASAWVMEDDYDSEYRYAGRPLASLQGLDADGRVIYMGTFSKVLFPALRLGFAIVSPALVEPFQRTRAMVDRHSPTLEQAALADFIAEGHMARHIRRMRSLYAARHDALMDLAHRHLRGMLDVQPAETGMHVVGWLPQGIDDREVTDQAQLAGLVTPPVSPHYLGSPPRQGGLLLGFSAFDEAQLADGVTRLAAVLRHTSRRGQLRAQ